MPLHVPSCQDDVSAGEPLRTTDGVIRRSERLMTDLVRIEDGPPIPFRHEVEMSTKVKKYRERAFRAQKGHCYYCRCRMWDSEGWEAFRKEHSLTPGQAKQLRCTAEHVVARSERGRDVAQNIVAACLYCNRGRHARRTPKASQDFAAYVRERLSAIRWHSFDVRVRGLLPSEASQSG